MRKVYIYGLFKSNQPFYVGKTKNLKQRKENHIFKHGKNIEFVVLEELETEQYINSCCISHLMEYFWINQFRSWGFKLINTKYPKVNYKRKIKFNILTPINQ